ncbi:MAG: FTR1 family iron permease [Thainema sp.]
MDITAALPTFVITLREGVEAALVVGIVMAYLKQADRTSLNRWVFGGIGVGLLVSVLVGVGFNRLMAWLQASDQPYATVVEPLLETTFGIVAIALLSWMLVWMTQQAKGLKAEVQGAVDEALEQSGGAGWAIFTLILIAVLREGFETVVFISAQFQDGWTPVVGAIAGLLGAVLIGILLFRLGVRINLKQFFQGMGVLLLLIVAGLVIGSLHHLDETVLALAQIAPDRVPFCSPGHESCLLGIQLWDLSGILPDRTFPGVLLKALLGYRDHLYAVQAVAYLVFLTSVGGMYLRSLSDNLPSEASTAG